MSEEKKKKKRDTYGFIQLLDMIGAATSRIVRNVKWMIFCRVRHLEATFNDERVIASTDNVKFWN